MENGGTQQYGKSCFRFVLSRHCAYATLAAYIILQYHLQYSPRCLLPSLGRFVSVTWSYLSAACRIKLESWNLFGLAYINMCSKPPPFRIIPSCKQGGKNKELSLLCCTVNRHNLRVSWVNTRWNAAINTATFNEKIVYPLIHFVGDVKYSYKYVFIMKLFYWAYCELSARWSGNAKITVVGKYFYKLSEVTARKISIFFTDNLQSNNRITLRVCYILVSLSIWNINGRVGGSIAVVYVTLRTGYINVIKICLLPSLSRFIRLALPFPAAFSCRSLFFFCFCFYFRTFLLAVLN